jgi:hypothetical protein
MVLVLATVAMISTALVVLPFQKVDARQKGIRADNTAANECSEGAFCQAQAIQFIDPRGTSGGISADKEASNECSGPVTTCLAGAQQTIAPPIPPP